MTSEPAVVAEALPWVRLAYAEIDYALARAGIGHMMIKGPTVADWLFAGEYWPFNDVDVWVAPREVARAAAVLRGRGFSSIYDGVSPGELDDHSVTLRR